MKDYLYLNMDFLESFVAQQNGGLPEQVKKTKVEIETDAKKSSSVTIEASVDGKLDAILSYFGISVGAKYQTPSRFAARTKIEEEVLQMTQRDNMFDSFVQHEKLNEESTISQITKDHVRKYVCLKTDFDFVSISRLEALSTLELRDFYSSHKAKPVEMDEIQRISQQVSLLKTLFPYDSFLTSKGVIVLLEEKYLREAKSQIGHKFNGEQVFVVGKVSKYAGKVRGKSAPINQTLDKIQNFTLQILQDLGIIQKDDSSDIFLITPVAIYT